MSLPTRHSMHPNGPHLTACNLMIDKLVAGEIVSTAEKFIGMLVYEAVDGPQRFGGVQRAATPCRKCRVVLVGMIMRHSNLDRGERAFLKTWYSAL